MNLQMYYNKRAAGGRSLTARVFDAIMLRAIIFSTLFITIFYLSFSMKLALIMSVFLTAAVSLFFTLLNRIKKKKFMDKDLKDLKEKCMLEELTFMDIEKFTEYISTLYDLNLKDIEQYPDGITAESNGCVLYVLQVHPSDVCEVSVILNIFRSADKNKKIIVLTMSSFSEEAKALCKQKDIKTIDGKAVLKKAADKDMLVSEQAAKEKAEQLMKDSLITLKEIKKNALSGVKIKGYIICGIITLFWPLINGFKFYYPIISLLCFALAVIAYKKRKTSQSNDENI